MTEEFAKIKAQLGLNDKDVEQDKGKGRTIKMQPPAGYVLTGYHFNTDVKLEDMDDNMKEISQVLGHLEEGKDKLVEEDEYEDFDDFDEDFIYKANDGQVAMVKMTEEEIEEKKKEDETKQEKLQEEVNNMPKDSFRPELAHLSEEAREAMRKAKEFLDSQPKPEGSVTDTETTDKRT